MIGFSPSCCGSSHPSHFIHPRPRDIRFRFRSCCCRCCFCWKWNLLLWYHRQWLFFFREKWNRNYFAIKTSLISRRWTRRCWIRELFPFFFLLSCSANFDYWKRKTSLLWTLHRESMSRSRGNRKSLASMSDVTQFGEQIKRNIGLELVRKVVLYEGSA